MDYLLANDGTRYSLSQWPVTIGRNPNNVITIANGSLSEYHVRLDRQGGNVIIFDLNSANGTLVNGQRLFQSHKLSPGDQVQLGNLKFSFNPEQEATVFCSNCGQGIRPGVKFCRFCGRPQVIAPPPSPPPPPPPPPPVNDPTEILPAGVYTPPKPLPKYIPPTPPPYDSPPPYNQPPPYNSSPPYNQPPVYNSPSFSVDRGVHLSPALGVAFTDPGWVGKMIVGSLLYLFLPIVNGYALELMRRVINDDPQPMPDWDDWSQKFKDGRSFMGLIMIGVLVCALPPTLPGLLLLWMDPNSVGGVVLAIGGELLGIGFFLFLLPVMVGRYLTTNRFMDGLNFVAVWGQIQNNFGRYLGNWLTMAFKFLVVLILVIILCLVLIWPVCTIPLILPCAFYLMLFQMHLMGQLYRTTL